MVGAGIYVLTGTVAKDIAGPGIILSFLLASLACLLSALCYAEFGTRVPKAGSAYVYTYISIGEFWAFVIGWNILLEHMIGGLQFAQKWHWVNVRLDFRSCLSGSSVERLCWLTFWRSYQQHHYCHNRRNARTVVGKVSWLFGFHRLPRLCPFAWLADWYSFKAFLIIRINVAGIGVKGSAMVNSFLTIINLSVMGIVIGMGFYYANQENWTKGGGFLPYGFSGVIAGNIS